MRELQCVYSSVDLGLILPQFWSTFTKGRKATKKSLLQAKERGRFLLSVDGRIDVIIFGSERQLSQLAGGRRIQHPGERERESSICVNTNEKSAAIVASANSFFPPPSQERLVIATTQLGGRVCCQRKQPFLADYGRGTSLFI